MPAKEITFHQAAREEILRGVKTLSAAVDEVLNHPDGRTKTFRRHILTCHRAGNLRCRSRERTWRRMRGIGRHVPHPPPFRALHLAHQPSIVLDLLAPSQDVPRRFSHRSDAIADCGHAGVLSTMCAAVHRTACLDSMADDLAMAMPAGRCQRVNRAFEAVECARPTVHRDVERLVVIVSADITGRHRRSPRSVPGHRI